MKNGTLGAWLMMKRLGILWLWRRKDSEPSEPQDKVQISADNWDLLPDFAELNNEGRSYAQLLDSYISWIEERENCARGKLTNEDMWKTNTFQDCNSPTILISLWPLREKIWHQGQYYILLRNEHSDKLLKYSQTVPEPVILFYLENTSFGSFH